jgi:Carboxypeptidase regulatory-like domain/TonB-dependent Receptor Plug Domain
MSSRILPLIACLLIASSGSVFGQAGTSTLSGTIMDETNAVIPDVTVTVINLGTRTKRDATTSAEGRFAFPLLPPGRYQVMAERQGFAPFQVPELTLNVDDQVAITMKLKLAAGGETVSVVADLSRVSTSPAVGTVVDRQFLENMPLNGRSFQSLLTLTPGVVLVSGNTNYGGNFSVNGQRAESNYFTVDGVSANLAGAGGYGASAQVSGNLPSLTTFGTTQSLASVDAVQEFKVQTSSFSAEYGRQPGGQISISTRSGTNQFNGSLFEYFRDDAMDASDWFANRAGLPKPPMRQHDFGGTVGGPLQLPGYDGRNRTFFFVSYEGLQLRVPQFQLTNVPTPALRQAAPAPLRPLLNGFPLPNGKDLGNGMAEFSASYADPSSLNATSVRIDQAAAKWLTVFGRYSHTPSDSSQRFSNLANTITQKASAQAITLGGTALLSPKVATDFRINYSRNLATRVYTLDDFGGAVPYGPELLLLDQYWSPSARGTIILGFPGQTATSTPLSYTTPGPQDGTQRQWNIVLNTSYALGAHQLKFGIDARHLSPTYDPESYGASLRFSNQEQVLNAIAGTATIQTREVGHPLYSEFSAYVQDNWSIGRRLTLSLGVRWEVNPAPGESAGKYTLAVTQIDDLATMELAPLGTRAWKTTYDNVAPRFGLAYRLSTEPGRETVIRTGAGIFYDTGNQEASGVFRGYPYVTSKSVPNVAYPLIASQVAPLEVSLTPPYGSFLWAFDPSLELPYTAQWNVAVEQAVGRNQTFTVTYVGAAGRRLLQLTGKNIATINPKFTTVNVTTNGATSDYHALQAQYQRRLSRGVQALVSYTWAHAIDEDSVSNSAITPTRGNANFDVRHNFGAAVTYDIPTLPGNRLTRALLGDWSADTNFHIQSALPLEILAGSVQVNPVDGSNYYVRPNVVAGVPRYLDDPLAPGGRRINAAAFSTPSAGQSGDLGRNAVRGLGVWQVDFALRRQFTLPSHVRVQFRAEAFNLFNHPNFGSITTQLTNANFGQPTQMLSNAVAGISPLYQMGGRRAIQLAVKLQF